MCQRETDASENAKVEIRLKERFLPPVEMTDLRAVPGGGFASVPGGRFDRDENLDAFVLQFSRWGARSMWDQDQCVQAKACATGRTEWHTRTCGSLCGSWRRKGN